MPCHVHAQIPHAPGAASTKEAVAPQPWGPMRQRKAFSRACSAWIHHPADGLQARLLAYNGIEAAQMIAIAAPAWKCRHVAAFRGQSAMAFEKFHSATRARDPLSPESTPFSQLLNAPGHWRTFLRKSVEGPSHFGVCPSGGNRHFALERSEAGLCETLLALGEQSLACSGLS
jgi:hypothetical protein